MEDINPGKAKRSMDNWQLTPTYIGCPASGGCNNPRASFSNMKGITFSTRSCLLLAWNCVAGTQLDPSFSLLTVHGWFGLVFFWYNTKSFIQATYTLWVFLLCAAQESNSLERQDWPSCSCPPLVLMQSELYSWKKYLPRHTLCAWRGWSRAEGCLLNPVPFQNSFLVTLYQNYFQQWQSNHWVWITTDS